MDDYFPINYVRITFQNILFHNIYNYFKFVIKDYNLTRKIYRLCLDLKKLYPNGYYIYGPKFNDYYTSSKDIKLLTNYIARYASHPPISERRILKLDTSNNTITWFYDPHEDDDIMDEEFKKGRQIITEDVFDFIARLIIHIPNKGFQQIRYYGFYSNKFLNKIKYINLFSNAELSKMSNNVYWVNALKVSFGYDPTHCTCGNQMLLIYELSSYP